DSGRRLRRPRLVVQDAQRQAPTTPDQEGVRGGAACRGPVARVQGQPVGAGSMEAPVIIEAAINGGVSKDRNPHTPRTPDEIAADALACLSAGAAIIHNHIDLRGASDDEAAARYLEAWRPVLAKRPDALLYP